jgi:hypothetical protein
MGDWEAGLFFVGSNVVKCSEMSTVAAIFKELVGE